MLLLRINHEDGVGHPLEVGDTAQVTVKLLEFTAVAQRFTLGHVVEITRAFHGAKFNHALDATGDRREVGEHATEPALVDERHTTGLRVVRNRALGLLLRADEQDDASLGNEVAHVGVTRFDARESLAKVDEVDAVALTKDETTHLGIPPSGLVPEVHTRVQ